MALSAGPGDTAKEATESRAPSIEIGELLQVRVPNEKNSPTYSSRVDDISDGKFLIAWPTHEGIRIITHRDHILDFFFVCNGEPHEFTGMVDGLHSEHLPQLTIIQTSGIVKAQRRQNFRIKCLIPIEVVGTVREGNDDMTPTSLFLKTTTSDLSAGGMSFRHARHIPEGTQVEVKLSLPDNAPVIRIPCRVVHSDSSGETHTNRIGLQYIAITESERARIVRFIYRTQLKGLRD